MRLVRVRKEKERVAKTMNGRRLRRRLRVQVCKWLFLVLSVPQANVSLT